MKIEIVRRRELIRDLFNRGDFRELASFGIERIAEPAVGDCGHYVLNELGFRASQTEIDALRKVPRVFQRVEGVVFYRNQDPVPLHYGFFDGNRVISKWYLPRDGNDKRDKWPVMRHALEDVPPEYGMIAEFQSRDKVRGYIQDALHFRLFELD
ncbi:hypothetical protein HY489_06770 [Candidatus Woesearchaeota archaeon]|nr:hypothetical protein [Candidatus Woesearchaeota archaeon]